MSQTFAVGTEQTVIVCTQSQTTQSPCPAGTAPSTMVGYVINPGQAGNIEAQFEPFDYAAASTIWGLAFTFVVGLYLVSKSAGVILAAIRNF